MLFFLISKMRKGIKKREKKSLILAGKVENEKIYGI